MNQFPKTYAMDWSTTHNWSRRLITDSKGRWYVAAYQPFCTSGFAVIDDFGNLVEVPQ